MQKKKKSTLGNEWHRDTSEDYTMTGPDNLI